MKTVTEPYGGGLEVWWGIPDGQPRALMVCFHGGGWLGGAPRSFGAYWPAIVESGILCAAPSYPLGNIYPALSAAEEAARYLRGKHPDLPLFLHGHSAGGLMAVAANCAVHAAGLCLVNPVLDLSATGFRNKATPPNGDETISPLHLVGKMPFPPTLVIQGDADEIVSPRAASQFVHLLRTHRVDATLRMFPGQGHGFCAHEPFTSEMNYSMLAFIDRVLRGLSRPSSLSRYCKSSHLPLWRRLLSPRHLSSRSSG